MREIITGKEILTREEVMEILKIGRSTFYKLLQTGELKGFKEGNRYKVPVQSIEEYVEKKMKIWIVKMPKVYHGVFCYKKFFCTSVYRRSVCGNFCEMLEKL